MASRSFGCRLIQTYSLTAILAGNTAVLAQQSTYQQPFDVSYSVVSDLNLDSVYMRSWVDITLRLVDSTPCPSFRISFDRDISLDSLLVDGARVSRNAMDTLSVHHWSYELNIPVLPPMVVGQSRLVSLACHYKVRKKDTGKRIFVLWSSIPQMIWRMRPGPGVVFSGEGLYYCRANVDYRLTVFPPTLVVGEGELLNEAEFIMTSSKPRDTVLTDLIAEQKFSAKSTRDRSGDRIQAATFLWRCEDVVDFAPVLLRDYALDRTWVGETPIDLYYPRKSRDRWAGWAIPVIAEALKDSRGAGNLGAYPIRFVIGKPKYLPGSLGVTIIPDKKFSADKLRAFVSDRAR